MKYTESIEKLVRDFCVGKKAQVKTTSKLDKKIIENSILAQNKTITKQSAALQFDVWRIIMRNRTIKYTAAAMILFVIIIGFIEIGKPGGASVAFAAAMDKIKHAGTFSCTETFQMTYQDGEKHGKFLMKQKWMFKEPNLERHEKLTSPWPRFIGEVTIMDYDTRQQLELRPVEKTAILSDMSSDYTIDEKTGELKLTQLDTSLRDRLLKLSAGAVEDFGMVELDRKSVQMLQSHKNNRIATVWIDPVTYYPVQIELKWTDENRSPVIYSSIQIDTELNDDLFSLEVPDGYTRIIEKPDWPDYKNKISTKIMRLGLWCWVYASNNDDQFPDHLADIVRSGVITENVLNKVLTAPDDPDGPPVFRYRKPNTDAKDRSNEVMLYEIYDQRPQDRVVACFADGHAELVPVRVLEQYLKPWPVDRKKVSACMAYLYKHCNNYAKDHEGQYPRELTDLIGNDVSHEAITRLLNVWGQRDGQQVIQYHPPRTYAEPSTEVIFYEIYDQWPDDGVVTCFADGHSELVADQNRFEELIK